MNAIFPATESSGRRIVQNLPWKRNVLLLMLKFMGNWRVPRVVTGEIIPEIRRESTYRAVLGTVVQSRGEIKRKEVSWTLRKKLDTFAGPGEIKKREVVLDPQVSPEEIKSREVELGLKVGLLLPQLFLNSGAKDIVFAAVPHSI